MDTDLLHKMIIYQKSYFEIIYDFFIKFMGKEPKDFHDFNEIGFYLKEKYEQNKHNMAYFSNLNQIRLEFFEKLTLLYSIESPQVFKSAQDLDVFKINLGGSSRFLKTQLNAVRKSLLLTDIVLIPDPILPWLERERGEEKFNNIRMIEAIFFILQLRDLLTEDFDIPPFFIFPSWEKILEEKDSYTKESISTLLVDFFNFYVGTSFDNKNDLIKYAFNNRDEFLKNVENKRLFIAPNGLETFSLRKSIDDYKVYVKENRTDEWCHQYLKDDIQIVLNGISERLAPQFHLFDNSKEMKSNPYLCIPEHAHYYKLISKMSWSYNVDEVIDKQTQTILEALSSQRLDYLANISDDEIKMLRKTDEHILFKKEMRDFVNSLSNSKIEDIHYVSREFSDFLRMKTSQHIKELEVLKSKYRAKHTQTLLLAGGTLAVNFMPLIGPVLSAVLGVGGVGFKYASDKSDEINDLKKMNSSMLGVIALTKARQR
ncbi:hypothetical protein [Acinetobacter sp. ASP199]|uniref:hypothetical protein n=1 Tax=unclassified Acinetobacter TaxID=196816 RepID=UPI001F611DA9|nr:hypothetical protein [Acinetobacter sp. ASP199]UNT58699.1 hypothetical protein IHE35_11380 [Acinetobacter sp. ASP199]